jgi:phage terminase Nu1 subunit (DNA packaging protein)
MKLERFDTEINWYGDKIHIIASDDGEWVKASDAEALKERIAELKLAVERATANMVAAQNRAAELEKALFAISVAAKIHGDLSLVKYCDEILEAKG